MSDFDFISETLRSDDPGTLMSLWKEADNVRRVNVGNEIHLRGLIEVSNICRRNCQYCGIRTGNKSVERYRLTRSEILNCVEKALEFDYGSIVLQAGEDVGIDGPWMAEIIAEIKKKTPLAITLSLGGRDENDYHLWKEAGSDRYLLRFETSNPTLFAAIHPPLPNRKPVDRQKLLLKLREIGYEIGSGVMIGIPGQSYEDLARDIELFSKMELDMIGCGPFVPHPQTPLGILFEEKDEKIKQKMMVEAGIPRIDPSDQVPATIEMAFKVIALVRLTCPKANIPCTTAVATIDRQDGRKLGLCRGANVVMPNLTPIQYRKLYEIYPNKAAIYETAEETHETVVRNIHEIGRVIGKGRGDSQIMNERK